jgi:hypothetical protein
VYWSVSKTIRRTETHAGQQVVISHEAKQEKQDWKVTEIKAACTQFHDLNEEVFKKNMIKGHGAAKKVKRKIDGEEVELEGEQGMLLRDHAAELRRVKAVFEAHRKKPVAQRPEISAASWPAAAAAFNCEVQHSISSRLHPDGSPWSAQMPSWGILFGRPLYTVQRNGTLKKHDYSAAADRNMAGAEERNATGARTEAGEFARAAAAAAAAPAAGDGDDRRRPARAAVNREHVPSKHAPAKDNRVMREEIAAKKAAEEKKKKEAEKRRERAARKKAAKQATAATPIAAAVAVAVPAAANQQ